MEFTSPQISNQRILPYHRQQRLSLEYIMVVINVNVKSCYFVGCPVQSEYKFLAKTYFRDNLLNILYLICNILLITIFNGNEICKSILEPKLAHTII